MAPILLAEWVLSSQNCKKIPRSGDAVERTGVKIGAERAVTRVLGIQQGGPENGFMMLTIFLSKWVLLLLLRATLKLRKKYGGKATP
jgi:hypothetical protein